MKSRLVAVLALTMILGAYYGSAWACGGDDYWSEPAQVKTWYSRQLVSFTVADSKVTDDFLKDVLTSVGLSPCGVVEKDLIGQDVKVIRACRSNVKMQAISVRWDVYNECTQVLVRLLNRSGSQGTLEVLTRTKWGKDGTSFSPANEKSTRAAALAQLVASKVQEKLEQLK